MDRDACLRLLQESGCKVVEDGPEGAVYLVDRRGLAVARGLKLGEWELHPVITDGFYRPLLRVKARSAPS